jgi:hypothetical protein
MLKNGNNFGEMSKDTNIFKNELDKIKFEKQYTDLLKVLFSINTIKFSNPAILLFLI